MSFVNLESSTVYLGDSPQLDAFERLRVSLPKTLFDSQQEYVLSTRFWDTAVSGGSTVARNSNTRMVDITCSTGATASAILQSKAYHRYTPGKSHLIIMTGIFSPGTVANNVCRAGYFDSKNGIFFSVSNGVASIVRRSTTTGSTVEDGVTQSNWNVDKFNGQGPSRINGIDFTKSTILYISAQWLGMGRIEVGFNIGGRYVPAHRFLIANVISLPSTQTFNLPVRIESVNTDASAGALIHFNCCTVQTEGGEESRGFSRSASNGTTPIAVTTRQPVLSIRSAATFLGLDNRGHIEANDITMLVKTNDSFWELVYGGTLTGAAFTTVGAGSLAEFDVTATAITGGVVIKSGHASSSTGSASSLSLSNFDARIPLTISKIDSGAVQQDIVSLVFTSMSGTSNVAATANWFEQFV